MKAYQSLYLIICILSLLFTPGCKEDEAPQALEERRTITIDLGVAISRAPEDGTTDNPTNMQLWIFDQTGEKVFYKALDETSLTWISNDFLSIAEQEIPIKDGAEDLHFHVVMNSQNATFTPSLDENTTESAIQSATFTSLNGNLTDNQVPMYGSAVKENISLNNRYAISINVKRAVGKLELYFTKTSADTYLKINSIKLEQVPDKSYLASQTAMPADINYTNPDNLFFENTTDETIGTSLSNDILIGDFSNYESSFKQLVLPNPYLLENLNGDTWTQTSGKDDIYPDNITDQETRYKLIVDYQTASTSTQTKEIYLPKFERNNLYKIFARVKDDGISLAFQVMPWEHEEWTVEWSYAYDFSCTVEKNPIVDENETYYPIVYTATNDPSQLNDIFINFQLNEPAGTRWVASLDNGQDFFFCDPNSNNPSIDDHYVPGGYAGDSQVTIRIKAFGEYNPDNPQTVRFAIRVLYPEGTWNRLMNLIEENNGEDYILIKQVTD